MGWECAALKDNGTKYVAYLITYFFLLASAGGIISVLVSNPQTETWQKSCNILTAVCSCAAILVQSSVIVYHRWLQRTFGGCTLNNIPKNAQCCCMSVLIWGWGVPVYAFLMLFEAHQNVKDLALNNLAHLRVVIGIESISSWTQVYIMFKIIQNNWRNWSVWYNLSVSMLYGIVGIMWTLYQLRNHVNEASDHPEAFITKSQCRTPGCNRETWDGNPGSDCCRACKSSKGRRHGPSCEQKAASAAGNSV